MGLFYADPEDPLSEKTNDACAVCPFWLSRRPEVHPLAKLVYGRLFRVAADLDFQWFFPDVAALAASLGVTKGQFIYHATVLRNLKLILVKPCMHPEGRSVRAYAIVHEHPWIAEADAAEPPPPLLFLPAEELIRVRAAKRPLLRLVP
jgi:hypothetical protein